MSESQLSYISSQIIGWIYFTAWTISFYGQIYENYKLKRAEGIKFDYVYLNLTGYAFYSIALSVGYFDLSEGAIKGVQIQDILFAYHGAIMTLVQLIQMFIYPTGSNKLSKMIKFSIAFYWLFFIFYFYLTNISNSINPPTYLNVWNMIGYIKVIITVKKYVIQSYYNYKRKSTEGWSIFNVLCDFTGGVLSFVQVLIDHIFRGISIVFPKIALGLFTIIFDLIFILQHYVIYKDSLQEDTRKLYQMQELEDNKVNQIQEDQQISTDYQEFNIKKLSNTQNIQ
ncbi:PQ loop protein (macronuclear) [Tetrahymena thermophila SB210]|uniref:PQ loop protein n=1 Tax=Tetrahymena thermophila (strain SB210) TaxID=312017 RepID=W7XJ35_TETTS|nr:PQ loop protein [Tetrahymena thermophila SB210]EWS73814.1 PQ loop protein [Tetrahymena thermophila SB210]|eukprot:XP_012653637.1 PQ loop protein [Tetrahymena thermophila SB210]